MSGFVFIHGWGLDDHFWDDLRALLSATQNNNKRVLIGHSLGFMQGLRQRQDWDAWIAVNSFARFIDAPPNGGCVPAAVLRDMRVRLNADVGKTLQGFYKLISVKSPRENPDIDTLRQGLDELCDSDVSEILVQMSKPGLVLASRHDPLVPIAASENLARYGDIHWHETGGHVVPQSDAAWCAEKITRFIHERVMS